MVMNRGRVASSSPRTQQPSEDNLKLVICMIFVEFFIPGDTKNELVEGLIHMKSHFWCDVEAWLIDISDYIRLYGASDKLFHLRSRGRSHSSDASQRKKEDPGTTNLLVPHRERCLGTRGGV
ncbi:hypothetical protein TNCV_4875931 [Trichonephila clavipes]|nr:hypothetical protein TNCV_4875931 [Trichonephila clavipes]